jgi:glutathione S-transferase
MIGGKKWFVGENISIADVSFLTWYEGAYLVDVDLAVGFPEWRSGWRLRSGFRILWRGA